MPSKKKEPKIEKVGDRLTKFQTPHTYAIIFFVVLACWILTFMVPAGHFTTHDVEYMGSNGEIKTKTVLIAETFRYSYNLDTAQLSKDLNKLSGDTAKLGELEVDPAALDEFLKTDPTTWDQGQLDELGLTDAKLFGMYGNTMYDTSQKLHKVAKVWGTDDYDGFGFMNYIFEGLVTGDRYGSAVGIVALILVVG